MSAHVIKKLAKNRPEISRIDDKIEVFGRPEGVILLCNKHRKSWLFSDSQDGAEASMLCYTIIEMAKTYNLKIYDYILFLLSERPGKDMTDEGLDNLSPWSDGIGDRIDEFIKSRESR